MDGLDLIFGSFGDGLDQRRVGSALKGKLQSAAKPKRSGLKKATIHDWRRTIGRWIRRSRGKIVCDVCHSEWDAATVRKTHLKQHALSVKHRQNETGVIGANKHENATALNLAPSVHEFHQCVVRRLKGLSYRGSDPGLPREQKMAWCLSEALLDQERRKLSKAHSVGVSQDVQGSTLSVRVGFCYGQKLNLSRTLLGYLRCKPGSEGVAAATKRVVRNFFTKRNSPPTGWTGKRCNYFMSAAMKEFCKKVATLLSIDVFNVT